MTRSILVRQLVPATREELWSACATARGLSTWQADTAQGQVAQGSTVTLSWPTLRLSVKLDVAEVVPEQRIVWKVGNSRLTLELEPGEIRLLHEGLRSEDEEDGMRSAWRTSLGLLAHGLTKHRGHERTVRWLTRTARCSPGMCHLFFTQRAALSQWLTRTGEIGHEGTSVSLGLLTGDNVTGEVLANTPDRDVAFTWQEQGDSCVVLRTFPSPESAEDRLLALAWSRWDLKPPPEETIKGLENSLDRLARVLNRRGSA